MIYRYNQLYFSTRKFLSEVQFTQCIELRRHTVNHLRGSGNPFLFEQFVTDLQIAPWLYFGYDPDHDREKLNDRRFFRREIRAARKLFTHIRAMISFRKLCAILGIAGQYQRMIRFVSEVSFWRIRNKLSNPMNRSV